MFVIIRNHPQTSRNSIKPSTNNKTFSKMLQGTKNVANIMAMPITSKILSKKSCIFSFCIF